MGKSEHQQRSDSPAYDLLTTSGRAGTEHRHISKLIAHKTNARYLCTGALFNAIAEMCDTDRVTVAQVARNQPSMIHTAIDACIQELVTRCTDSSAQDGDEADPLRPEHKTVGDLPDFIDSTLIKDTVTWLYTPEDPLVIDSITAGWIAGRDADFRVWCQSPDGIRLSKLDIDTDFITPTTGENPVEETLEAERRMNTTCMEKYNADLTDTSIYDLCINTSRWTIDDVSQNIVNLIHNYDETADSGRAPTQSAFTTVPKFSHNRHRPDCD